MYRSRQESLWEEYRARVNGVIDYIDENLDKDLSLVELVS